ncbi:aromatic prenyltransferase (DMATS family) [Venturia effusa]|uniref:Aromatic prenyltransferase (DMATS family) n=1 Tax=Venturia effusa TaxID=50376 RepID=A0A517LG18_9PEZI|nr:aromatic prenyltransferase (DMATS family) [Venturia effusa]
MSLGVPLSIMQEQDRYAQVLQNAMELCHYDTSIRSEVLGWFEDSILPLIQPGPKSRWVPTLTHYNTAFEPSITTRGDGPKDKNLRITIEPIGPQATSEKDKWNQETLHQILEKLKENIRNLDLELFNHFSKALFITPQDEWRKYEKPIPEVTPSCFLAFDIDRSKGISGIGSKAYLFPQLKSLQTGISPGSIIEEAITQLHDDDKFDVIPPVEMVMEYLQEPGSTLTLNDVEMINFDLVALDQNPRIKIYAHSWRNTFDAAEDVYTLGGLLPENKEQLDALEEFWKVLSNDAHEPEDWKSMPFKPLDEKDERSRFIYSFEIMPGELVPEMKVYFPMWCFSKSDEDVRRRLDMFFELKGWKGLVGVYEKDLGTFPTRDVEKKSGLHTYVSYAKDKEGEDYVTVYWAGEAVQVNS